MTQEELEQEVKWLEPQCDELLADAERYRFLRKFLTPKDMPILTGRGERDAPDERDTVDFFVDLTIALYQRRK